MSWLHGRRQEPVAIVVPATEIPRLVRDCERHLGLVTLAHGVPLRIRTYVGSSVDDFRTHVVVTIPGDLVAELMGRLPEATLQREYGGG